MTLIMYVDLTWSAWHILKALIWKEWSARGGLVTLVTTRLAVMLESKHVVNIPDNCFQD